MLALRDLLRDLAVRVVAGEAGTGGAVRWVHISEIVDPTPWLSGGELLLTTGLQLADPATQRAYVERLAGHELAGLGFGTGFTHDAVPAPMVEAADELGFPLFEVPYEVPFIAVTEKAFTHLVNEHYAVLQRALSAHERLERIVLSERGLDGVAGALASLVGGAAIIFDARGDVLARRAAGEPLPDAVVAELAEELGERAAGRRPARLRPRRRAGGPGARRCPCRARRRTRPGRRRRATGPRRRHGWWRPRTAAPLTELDRLTLHQAVTVVALELLRRRVADDTERRLAGDVLSSLVTGELSGADLARRLEPFGLRDRAAVIVLAPPRQFKAATEDALGRALREEAPAGLVGEHRALLLRAPDSAARRRRRGAVRARLARARARVAGGRRGAGRGRGPPGRARRPAPRVPRGPLRARGPRAGRQRLRARARHLPRPRLLPAPALAAGRRGAAAVLRLDPRPDRGGRGRLRRAS